MTHAADKTSVFQLYMCGFTSSPHNSAYVSAHFSAKCLFSFSAGQTHDVASPPGYSLSSSMGMSQQPGPSGLNFLSLSLSPSIGGQNLPPSSFSPPQPIPTRVIARVYSVHMPRADLSLFCCECVHLPLLLGVLYVDRIAVENPHSQALSLHAIAPSYNFHI